MYDKVKERLEKVGGKNKVNIENQVERIHDRAVTNLIQRKEGVNRYLNPNNPIAREILERSIVREVKDGTDTL